MTGAKDNRNLLPGIIGLILLTGSALSVAQNTEKIEYGIIFEGQTSFVVFPEENKGVRIPTDSVEAFTSGYQEYLLNTLVHEMSYMGLKMKGFRYVKEDIIQPVPCAVGFLFYLNEIRNYPYKESLRLYEIH